MCGWPNNPFGKLALMLAVALTLSACGRNTEPSPKGKGSEAHKTGGILRLSQRNEPGDLDPARASIPDDYFVIRCLSEGLVAPSPDGKNVMPAAADTWKRSDDGLRYTFHLRTGARWSNGDLVCAADFVMSYRRALEPGTASPKAKLFSSVLGADEFNSGELKDFQRVGFKALDTNTLEVTLKQPQPGFLLYAASGPWLPVHSATVESKGRAWTRPEHYVGNGPFVLTEWKPQQVITVRKRPEYWDSAAVKVSEIRFLSYDNGESEERAFRAGQLDVTMSVPVSKIQAYTAQGAGILRRAPLQETRYLAFNVTRGALKSVAVRRALSLAIDRKSIAATILGGGQEATSRLLHPGLGGLLEMKEDYRAQVKLAKELLKDAGYPEGRGFPKLELSGWTNVPVLEAVQNMWRRELGVEVSLSTRDAKTHVAALRSGNFDIGFITSIPDVADAALVLGEFLPGAAGNYPQWKEPRFVQQLGYTLAQTEDGARRAAMLRAEELLLNECPLAPLYFNTRVYLVRPSVKAWTEDGLWGRFYKGVELSEKLKD